MKDTWQFLSSHHIVLHHDICFLLSRQHDQLIMEACISLNVPLDDLKACNHCRMYLRALYLSNIITGDGMYVDESAWNGTPYIPPHKLKSWSHYGKPDRSSWKKWRKWVKIAFLGRGRRLRNPLGNWLQRDDNWPWYTSDDGCLTSLTLLNGYCMLLFLDIVNSPPLNESVKFVNLQRKSIGLLFTRKAIG